MYTAEPDILNPKKNKIYFKASLQENPPGWDKFLFLASFFW
jgi:hypothetical protein